MSYDVKASRRIAIFDTTLRDGEQAPGFSMEIGAKLAMAAALRRLNVDVIEAGFAAASPGDAEAVRRIAEDIVGPTICSLSRTRDEDIMAAERALAPARRRRLHIFLGTSPTHRQAKLKMSTDEILREIARSIASARGRFDEIEFSAEDAIRTERPFLKEALECAAEAGAHVLNVPDTVGYSTPDEIFDLFTDLIATVKRPRGVIYSAHCHDDLGMAVANSLAALRAGADQVECAINGIGERAGNCALEEVVMALRTRRDHFGLACGVVTEELYPASRLLGDLTGQRAPRNKAIIGRNAFAHEAGIHQHGVLEDRRTYEIMSPADIGAPASELVLGKHSGKHALMARASSIGVALEGPRADDVFGAFKALCDTRREVTDEDVVGLLLGDQDAAPTWTLVRVEMRASEEERARPFARVALDHATRGRVTEIGGGEGPFQAVFAALCAATACPAKIVSFEIAATPEGGEARLRIQYTDQIFDSRDIDRDPFLASARAIVGAFNQIERRRRVAAAALESAA